MPASSQAHRLLFVLPFAPRLDGVHGGSRVTAQLLTQLAPRHHIALIYLRARHEPPLDPALRELCDVIEEVTLPDRYQTPWRRRLHHARNWARLLRGIPLWVSDRASHECSQRLWRLAHCWQPQIVQLEFAVMGQYLPTLNTCPAPRILVQHEPTAQATLDAWRSGRASGRILPLLELRAWRRFETQVMHRVQTVVVFTERDRRALASWAAPTPVVPIPLGTSIPQQALNPLGCSPASLVFVGNFMHRPNVDAAHTLINTIYPAIQRRHPGAKLYLVGANPPDELRRHANDQLIITGNVPDVTPYLDQASVVVIPLRLGGGMRIKVLEALAAGKAIVASPLAVEGLDILDGQHIRIAERDEDFIAAIDDLLTHPEQRQAIAVAARAWAKRNLGWERSVAAYERLYDTLIEDKRNAA